MYNFLLKGNMGAIESQKLNDERENKHEATTS